MAKTAYVSFRASELESELQARDYDNSLGLAAKRDLERYYLLVRDELATVDFTPEEVRMLCNALRGDKIAGPRYRTLLWASVHELEHRVLLGQKEVDERKQNLVTKLRKLTPGQ